MHTHTHVYLNKLRVPDRNREQHLLEYVHRERDRKSQKICAIFNQLTQEEVDVMLMDCACNEVL